MPRSRSLRPVTQVRRTAFEFATDCVKEIGYALVIAALSAAVAVATASGHTPAPAPTPAPTPTTTPAPFTASWI